LQLALGVSFAVHAALLTVRFVDPEGFNRVFQDTPLEVILVNAKSEELPEKAMAIAQASWPVAAMQKKAGPPRRCRPI
jgi:periplasmic protein TonB